MWMHGPFVDLALIGFCWLPLYLAYAFLAFTQPGFACDAHIQQSCPSTIAALIVITLFLNRLHRHYSLGFAYGDKTEFRRHRKIYTWAPVITFALVVPCALYRTLDSGTLRAVLFGIYAFMATGSGVWQVYHTIMQKYGFLRIYSAKLRYGDARIEKHLFFSWLAVVIAGSAYKYAGRAPEIIFSGPREIRFLLYYYKYLPKLSLALLAPTLVYALAVTSSWSRTELRNFSRASIPKLLFVLSVALLLATLLHSLLIGVVVLGFSHAFEYSVFVNVFAVRKYKESSLRFSFFGIWANNVILCNMALAALMYALTLFFHLERIRPWGVLVAYAIFTSTLHFLYDGMLWKVSKPDVRSVLLELQTT